MRINGLDKSMDMHSGGIYEWPTVEVHPEFLLSTVTAIVFNLYYYFYYQYNYCNFYYSYSSYSTSKVKGQWVCCSSTVVFL